MFFRPSPVSLPLCHRDRSKWLGAQQFLTRVVTQHCADVLVSLPSWQRWDNFRLPLSVVSQHFMTGHQIPIEYFVVAIFNLNRSYEPQLRPNASDIFWSVYVIVCRYRVFPGPMPFVIIGSCLSVFSEQASTVVTIVYVEILLDSSRSSRHILCLSSSKALVLPSQVDVCLAATSSAARQSYFVVWNCSAFRFDDVPLLRRTESNILTLIRSAKKGIRFRTIQWKYEAQSRI